MALAPLRSAHGSKRPTQKRDRKTTETAGKSRDSSKSQIRRPPSSTDFSTHVRFDSRPRPYLRIQAGSSVPCKREETAEGLKKKEPHSRTNQTAVSSIPGNPTKSVWNPGPPSHSPDIPCSSLTAEEGYFGFESFWLRRQLRLQAL